MLAALLGRLHSGEPISDSPFSAEWRWWKGNLHTHTFWSDGDDFPEAVVAWYKDHGYHFLALSDHNVLSEGERWVDAEKHSGGRIAAALPKYRERFGPWVEEKTAGERPMVRLKPLSEFRTLFEQPGELLCTMNPTLVIDAETSFYFHREGPGVLMGMGSPRERPSFDTSVDEAFVSGELLPTAVRVFPPLEQAGVASMWAGLYEMTPDRHPILGPVADPQGLYLANGFSGHGFQHAPIVGKLLAEMIVEGAARTVDVSALSLERFARGELVTEAHVV
jgi:hypothetical protein